MSNTVGDPAKLPLALLLDSAINGINRALQPALGKDAVAQATGEDILPEQAASRIVSTSTALYGPYREQHQLGDNALSRAQFVATIGAGFEQGFRDAQQALAGREAAGEDVDAMFDRTFALVMRGLKEFATLAYSQPGGPMPRPDPV